MILPNVGSIAMWSPPLDHYGNSVRGVGFTRNLLRRFGDVTGQESLFHPFSAKRATLTRHHTLSTVGVPGSRMLHTRAMATHTTGRLNMSRCSAAGSLLKTARKLAR